MQLGVTGFSDADRDDWVLAQAYDGYAEHGYVTLSTTGDCPSVPGGACVRYTPIEGAATADCFDDWAVFTATDPDGSGQESEQFWLRLYINC